MIDPGLQQSDARARSAAQRVFDRPLVLEAGAGTGKTTALVARVLAWCLGEGWQRAEARSIDDEVGRSERVAARVLRGVVAITFTEKAAADMNRRVGEGLRDVAGGDWPGWLEEPALGAPDVWRERAIALRGSLDHLTMQTIHAWCRRLLSDHALDAGLHPNLDVDADRRRQRAIVREVIEESLETAYTADGPAAAGGAFLELAARGVGPRELETELLELVDSGVTPQALASDPSSPDRVAGFVERFERALSNALQCLGEPGALGGVGSATARRLEQACEALRERRPADAAELQSWLDELDWNDNEIDRIAKWSNRKFTKAEATALGDGAEAASRAVAGLRPLLLHARSLDLASLECGRSALVPMLARTDAAMRQRGVATFSALLANARDLLMQREDVAARVRSEIDQLMIDEFQDTDARQCDIIRALALRGPDVERPGLFLVGDPKQSIYGWRNADLAAYDAFVAGVLASGGVLERLSVNYRSVPMVLDEVERCIAPAMLEESGMQPPFQPLIPCPDRVASSGFARDGFGSVEHWVSSAWDATDAAPIRTRSVEASEIEARALADELRELHDRHEVRWESIGVLFRSRTDWEIYLAAMREAGVPYAVEGDRSYYRRREIIDAASLVRCVLDPDDSLALLTLLRSTWIGVPDAALIPLWARQLPDRIARLDGMDPNIADAVAALADSIREAARDVPSDVPGLDRIAGWQENLIDAVVAIAELRASFESDPSDVFVERLRTRTLFEAVESARYLGAWRCANLDRFFRDLRDRLADAGDTQALLRELRRAVVDEEESEEGRPVEIRSEAVCVMTIHGAKGLDFEHVYLMQLHKGSGTAPADERGASEIGGQFEYQLLGAATLNWDQVLAARRKVAEAERVRLLYVGMTRAKQRLVLAGVWPEFQTRKGRGQPNELLAHRPPDDLRERMIEVAALGVAGAAAGTGFADAHGVRWTIPALTRRAPVQPVLFDVDEISQPADTNVAEESQSLAALRVAATERMARPVALAASAAQTDVAGAGEATGREAYARQIGTAIHRILEQFDFSRPQFDWARDELAAELAATVEPEHLDAARKEATALLDRIARGRLFARLRELTDRIEAREFPVLCAPTDDSGPVAYWSGTIDLLYRDPETQRSVIVDYKTDRIDDPAQLTERANAYRAQGAVYQHAIRDAFELGYTPRFELWFLDADRVM